MKKSIFILVLLCATTAVWAQRKQTHRKTAAKQQTQKKAPAKSTAKPAANKPAAKEAAPDDVTQSKTVTITSSFKPSLRNASKINFSAATPVNDLELPKLQYRVPAQNLFFTYQPATLKPLALNPDSALRWDNSSYVKLGFGNYTTPFAQVGLSFGDPSKALVNVNADHISSKGSLPFQEYRKTGASVSGIFTPNDNVEWNGTVFFRNTNQYRYGFTPDTLKSYSKDSLKQQYTNFGIKVGLRNKQENEYGIDYNPTIAANAFSDNNHAREASFVLDAPLSKSFSKVFAFNLGVRADITSYKRDSVAKNISNNLFYVTPALQFKTPDFKLVAGVTPSWDNGAFHLLPNFTADARIVEERFVLQAGWVGSYNKNTYQSLSTTNPWLLQPTFLTNTRLGEEYAGFKGSAGAHFTYNARVSYLQIRNQALFVNDTLLGNSFNVVNENSMNDLRLHAEIGYTVQEKFSLLGGFSYNQYTNLKDNQKAWGLLPLEINGSLRWQVVKDFTFKSDVFFWDGPRYYNKSFGAGKQDPAVDLNLGAEFTVLPRLNIWLQVNNLFNNKYERWHQYQVLGTNVLGGVVYSFGQTAK
ncbi:TonB-dependent receptor [Deminuibacter soli]|uniref:TonB-dependent receptor n=1 Tax=Deminuibacter soli TaxID=2291815 RepID=A0A3E1NI01_9BACT|nr:TonB-dependent receptor [Deminuibacter soli]RFM27573.1 TonB-dependent receptor [Deminuibacter soli]